MTRARNRVRLLAAALLLVASVAIVATIGPSVFDRATHPMRYAISGPALLAPETYVAAAKVRVGAAARVTALDMPAGNAPVILSIWPSTVLYLDPPTARVLDLARTGREEGARPIGGAQQVASVIARARPYAAGGLRRVEWPTERSPDWTVRFGETGAVKVADDSGTARPAPARRPNGATALVARLSDVDTAHLAVRVAILLGAIAAALVALAALVRWARDGGRRS